MPSKNGKDARADVRVPFSSYLPLEYRERLKDLARRERKRVTELLVEALDLLFQKNSKSR